jgi:hypothetical protein
MAPWRLQPRAIDRVRFYANLSGYPAGDIYAEALSERGVQAAIARLREGTLRITPATAARPTP